MTNKDDAPNNSKAPKIAHPGMMGDGTEEQYIDEKEIPKSRIKKDEVEAAFVETNLNKMRCGHECYRARDGYGN